MGRRETLVNAACGIYALQEKARGPLAAKRGLGEQTASVVTGEAQPWGFYEEKIGGGKWFPREGTELYKRWVESQCRKESLRVKRCR
jgi:hypothetical protein